MKDLWYIVGGFLGAAVFLWAAVYGVRTGRLPTRGGCPERAGRVMFGVCIGLHVPIAIFMVTMAILLVRSR